MAQQRRITQIPSTTILGVRVSRVSKREALAWITSWITKGERKMVVTPNPEQVMMAQRDGSFRQILNKAELALADGVGLVWGSRILKLKVKSQKLKIIPERITGEEVMQELIRMAARRGWKVLFVGGHGETARLAAMKMQNSKFKVKNYSSKFKIKGIEGAKDIRHETDEERERVVRKINQFKPELLFVAYGAPWQEKWVARNLGKLEVKVAMVVGGAFDMIVDPTLRPPKWMTGLGVDWLYRLVRQPWRIRRQLRLLMFVSLVMKSLLSGSQVPDGP